MDRPLSGPAWLDRRKGNPGSTADLLQRLGRGDIELTHEAFHHLQPWRASRAVATRYDKRGYVFLGTATAASVAIWLRT
ncbi:hypothetical protein ACIQFZ_38565 [Streptomyces sp. NPDC093064]|uniref:hypothetical protein n=1 Tax=unclassified Streptomyces TaxID=2593676 RepID=UPI00344795C6